MSIECKHIFCPKKHQNMMKIKFIIILLSFAGLVQCQKKEIKATLDISIELENMNGREYADLRFLKIYKNDKIFKEIIANELPFIQHSIKLTDVKEGKYKFEFINIFEQKVSKEVLVDENKIYRISINPHYSDYKKNFAKSLIGNLNENENIKICYKSQGCFHQVKDSMIIFKKNKHYEIERNGLTTILNDNEVNNLIKMECELHNLKEIGCTTTDIYTFYKSNSKKEFTDDTCDWNGWENLKTNMKWK